MKIAVVRKKYTFHGGAEGFSSSFIEQLARDGHEIHIFAISWQADRPHENVHFHKVPAISFVSFLRDLTFAVFSCYMLRKERNHFDIIQSHDKTLYQDIYRAGDGCHREWLKQRLKRTGLPGKASVFLNPYHVLILLLERMILKGHRFRKVIAISEMVKRNVIDHYGVASDDIEVIYNGVDLDTFTPQNRKDYRSIIRRQYGITEEEFVILFVGSGFERKGVGYLIRAVESLSEPVSVLIVGKGKDPHVSSRNRGGIKGGYRQKIVFCGPQKDIHAYYAAADVFVFPTMYEPFGNVHLEALASGLPVITTGYSGAAEILHEGVQGFVVNEPEDIGGIARHIQTLFHDKEKLVAMGRNARRLAEGFTFGKHIDRMMALYARIRTDR